MNPRVSGSSAAVTATAILQTLPAGCDSGVGPRPAGHHGSGVT